ncbi:MAG: phage Gp37/Gp68 family protein [Bacteroidales bacterium]|nr:phage Gp37/Gp68 family protein [Bacteroidales bacterium]
MPSYWNPWYGCIKHSEGCKHCYVYRQDEMYGSGKRANQVTKNADFDLPIRRKRDKTYKLRSGQLIYTCMTSDFFVEQADQWRSEAWEMIRLRKDLRFFIFTKRIDRFRVNLPDDWGNGYDNVMIGCTVENQILADYRLSIFNELPIKHKVIIIAPMLEKMDISAYLDDEIREVATSGESGTEARILDYEWILDIRRQCIEKDIPFCFHQTGAKLLKDGKLYRIHRYHQISQANKASINYKLRRDFERDLKTEEICSQLKFF